VPQGSGVLGGSRPYSNTGTDVKPLVECIAA